MVSAMQVLHSARSQRRCCLGSSPRLERSKRPNSIRAGEAEPVSVDLRRAVSSHWLTRGAASKGNLKPPGGAAFRAFAEAGAVAPTLRSALVVDRELESRVRWEQLSYLPQTLGHRGGRQ